MHTTKRMKAISASITVLAIAVVAVVLAGDLASAGCQHVVAGPDDCTVCERYYLVGDDLCYENYYYCINTETGAIDGDFFDRCEPW